MKLTTRIILTIPLLLLSGTFSGCESDSSFSSASTWGGALPTTNANPNTPNPGNTSIVLNTFQPALAVRGIECLLCHAQINSSVITDFGYGDPQYFGNQNAADIYGQSAVFDNTKPLTLPWYGDYYGTWQLASQINGTIVVPKVAITDQRTLASVGMSASISLAQLMDLDLGASYYGGAPYSGAGPMDTQVAPLAGNPKIAEIDQLYIGAPTASQLLSLTANPANTAIGYEALAGSSVTGLGVQTGTGGSYVTNAATTIACTGDVVIRGPLFLNNVTISTDGNGCRLHATQSIFILGNISYSSTSGTENLQLVSAEAVLMGFNVATLTTRFGSWYPDSQPLTRAPGTNTQKNAAILAEAGVIGSALHDTTEAAYCPTPLVTYVGDNGGGSQTTLTQCSINFTRLLLDAPNIQSRYIGLFSGVAIAEIALFAPGALEFAYDPVFNTAPILPALPPMLEVPGLTLPILGN